MSARAKPAAARVAVVGSSNTDMILRVPKLPGPGETILGGSFSTAAGGKGANQAVAAARAGGRVSFIARVGPDSLGDEALQGFRREGIDVRHVSRDRAQPSGVALILVGGDGENSIGVASGANMRLSPRDIEGARAAISAARVVLLQLEIPLAAVLAAAETASRAGAEVILNPAPAQPLPDSLLRKVTLLTPNETEASLLTGIRVDSVPSAERAAKALQRRGARGVIVTLGAKGALVTCGGATYQVPGFRVSAVDTTAAGDVFNGALAVRLSEGAPLADCVRFAHAAAALSVTRLGAQPSIPSRRQIEALLRK